MPSMPAKDMTSILTAAGIDDIPVALAEAPLEWCLEASRPEVLEWLKCDCGVSQLVERQKIATALAKTARAIEAARTPEERAREVAGLQLGQKVSLQNGIEGLIVGLDAEAGTIDFCGFGEGVPLKGMKRKHFRA